MSCQCNAIQYVGNAFRGDSFLNPLSQLEIYEALKLNDWKDTSDNTPCIETDDGVNFYVHTNIRVGDGTTPTYMIIDGANIVFDMGKGFIKEQNSYLQVSSVWTPAEKALLFDTINAVKANQELRKGTITNANPTRYEFETDLTESINDFWNRGALKITSGQNEGIIRKIQDYVAIGNIITLRTALPYIPVTGDTFTIIPLRCFRVNYDDVSKIVNDIWDESMSEHVDAGSFGAGTQNIKIDVKQCLTLIGKNYRLKDVVRDAQGNMTTGTVCGYANAADAQNDVNAIITLSATGDVTGGLLTGALQLEV